MSVQLLDSSRYGYDFIAAPFVPDGADEYYLRDRQAALMAAGANTEAVFNAAGATDDAVTAFRSRFRPVNAAEVAMLTAAGCRSACWGDVLVTDDFDPALVRTTYFAGLVRIGALKAGVVKFHDFALPVGISDSRIIACDIGDNVAIHNCPYLAHYIVGEHSLLYMNNEIDATNHNKAGEGILKAGEDESARLWIETVNEAGGRAILPFRSMIAADAYLWATRRDDTALMSAFKTITQNSADARRGFYGVIGRGAVIKHCLIIKDANIGDYAYIKGANKLKNLTIRSFEDEPTQIGEGCELVNGIINSGCRVFYGCKAVRFVLGECGSLKYGARLLNSVLGDNSTVSCCEVLNNLVFPAHEQHHNNSFLIASLVMGQSNMAAGATVGSNHNSRGNDGEIIAGRGFWPGLSSTLKHNCRFASFSLLCKGNYPHELNITLPFALVTVNAEGTRREVMPAYWWLYNVYALERNKRKAPLRDKRKRPLQHYETDYLAPDTVGEIIAASALLSRWRRDSVYKDVYAPAGALERSRQPVRIVKTNEALAAYRAMLAYYAVRTLTGYFAGRGGADYFYAFQKKAPAAISLAWENLGGQLVPAAKAKALRNRIRNGSIASWEAVHNEYARLRAEAPLDYALNALAVLRHLVGETRISAEQWNAVVEEAVAATDYIAEQVLVTKRKDYTDPFRLITYHNGAERDAVVGRLEDNLCIRETRASCAREKAAFLASRLPV